MIFLLLYHEIRRSEFFNSNSLRFDSNNNRPVFSAGCQCAAVRKWGKQKRAKVLRKDLAERGVVIRDENKRQYVRMIG
ncbi:CysS/YqeB C-terminal domain-containing protein [Cytobacillus gottheilii]|uniref:CysS/YqeB C-terminal domain-containing protein n=1 Tax=Cytobacillus gottheilii TaxID=859144 RepID=UPI003F5AE062